MAKTSKPIRKMLMALSVLYGVYLLKTILGINLSGHHSAPGVFKAPLLPIEIGKEQLCKNEVEVACIRRKTLHRKFHRGLRKLIS